MTKYLVNGFSPSMLPLQESTSVTVTFQTINKEEFCSATNDNIVNAIGHAGTVALVNQLCHSNLNVNRIQIKANHGDEIYIITLTVRLEEGKVLNEQELQQLLQQNKVTFIKATIQ